MKGTQRIELERIERQLERFQRSRRPEDEGLPNKIQVIVDCIHKHLFDPNLSVKTVKARCGIGDNNISLHFRWELGKTIKDYIESLRLEAACRLLEESKCGVFDVALSVGYYHPQTFYRVFGRAFECTPAEYRRQLQSADGSSQSSGSRQRSQSGSPQGPTQGPTQGPSQLNGSIYGPGRSQDLASNSDP